MKMLDQLLRSQGFNKHGHPICSKLCKQSLVREGDYAKKSDMSTRERPYCKNVIIFSFFLFCFYCGICVSVNIFGFLVVFVFLLYHIIAPDLLLPLSTSTDSHWAPEEDIKQVSLFGNHLSICSVAPWLYILFYGNSAIVTLCSDQTVHNCEENLFMFLSSLKIRSLVCNNLTHNEWHCQGPTSAVK